MKRKLSVALAVEAATILREINSGRDGVLNLARQADLPCSDIEEEKRLLEEWLAFVHAAVLYGLMVHAPNIVVVEYTRSTRAMLEKSGYSPDGAERFIDGAFAAYVEPLLRGQTKECPSVFFHRLTGEAEPKPHSLAVVSGVMAMLFAAVLDKLEQYEYLLD